MNDDDSKYAKRGSFPCYCTAGISRLTAAAAMNVPPTNSLAPDRLIPENDMVAQHNGLRSTRYAFRDATLKKRAFKRRQTIAYESLN